MKAALVIIGSGPIVILTSPRDHQPTPAGELKTKGIDKFIAYEVPVEMAEARYGGHREVVQRDVHEPDDLRVLDFNGNHAFRRVPLSELGPPIMYEGPQQLLRIPD